MSALLSYVERNRLVMVSDSHVTGSTDPFPKFQIFKTRKGPAFVGGVGLRGVLARLFLPLQKICDEQGLTVLNFPEFLSGAVDFMLQQRKPEDVDVERDIVSPPAQLLIGGFDGKAARMRLWGVVKSGAGTGTLFEVAEHDFCALGFFKPVDVSAIQTFNVKVKREGPSITPEAIARMLGDQIDKFAAKYPDQIGRAAFFAAADERGLVQLTQTDFPTPWSLCERIAVAR